MKRTRSTSIRDNLSQPLGDLRKKTRSGVIASGSACIDGENASSYLLNSGKKIFGIDKNVDTRPKLNLRPGLKLAETTNIIESPKPDKLRNASVKRKAPTQSSSRQSTKRAKSALPAGHVPPRPPVDLYGDQWMDKQERSFLTWINHEFDRVAVTKNFLDDSSANGSLQHFTVCMEFAHICQVARSFFNDKSLQVILKKVNEAIDKKKLVVNTDSDFCMDISKRKSLIMVIMSFDTRWLMVALNIFSTRVIMPLSMLKQADVPVLIEEYVLGYSTALRRNVSGDGQSMLDHNKAVIKRLFAIILFLDRAKTANLIPSQPCLFAKNAAFKSCKAIINEIGRHCIAGEGDIIRHLSYLSYTVTCEQSSMDEYDYQVNNLAVDLRDGIRIARLIELHSSGAFQLTALKVPAIDRADKIRNLEICFKHLSKEGLKLSSFRDGRIKPEDIVDGHRKNTLEMLWRLILHWKVGGLVNQDEIRTETDQLICNYVRKFKARPAFDMENTVYLSTNPLSLLLRWCQAVGAFYNVKVSNFTSSFADGSMFCYLIGHYHPRLLKHRSILHASEETLKDERTRMSQYSDISSNSTSLTVNFSPIRSKRKLTPLQRTGLHNYQQLKEMSQQIGGIPLIFNDRDFTCTSSPDEKVVITYVSYLCSRLLVLSNETRAGKTIQRFWRQYGGNRYTSEHHAAASIIQKVVRRFLKQCQEERHRLSCITTIQAIWRGRMARNQVQLTRNAVITLQCYARAYLARRRVSLERTTILCQQLARGYLTRQLYQLQLARIIQLQSRIRGYLVRQFHELRKKEEKAALLIQTAYRRHQCSVWYQQLRQATLCIQRHRRATLHMRQTRITYLRVIGGIHMVQAMIRGRQARTRLATMLDAIVTVQSYIRRWHVQHRHFCQQQAAISVQKIWRGYLQRQRYYQIRRAVHIIQQQWRARQQGRVVRYQLAIQHNAATIIQSHYRGWHTRYYLSIYQRAVHVVEQRRWETIQARQQRHAYLCLKQATLQIQYRWRATLYARQICNCYTSWRIAAITIQRYVRGYQVRTRLEQLRCAVATIDQRRHQLLATRQQRHSFLQLHYATLWLQQHWRAILCGRQERAHYLQQRSAAIKIQSIFRGFIVRQQLARIQTSVRTIETIRHAQLQARMQRHNYLMLKSATIAMQKRWRAILLGRHVREQWQLHRWATITVQRYYRGYTVRRRLAVLRTSVAVMETRRTAILMARQQQASYQTLRRVVINIQRRRRSTIVTRQIQVEYRTVQHSIISIQSLVRGHLAREFTRQQKAAIHIQTAYRGYHQQMVYRQLRYTTIQMQHRRRATLIGRAVQIEFQWLRQATLTIQLRWRARQLGQIIRRDYLAVKQSINHVQALIRGYHARRIIELERAKRTFVVQLQAISRGYQTRLMLKQQHQAATRITAIYRGYVQRRAYVSLQQLVLGIQTCYRAQFARYRYQQMVQQRAEQCKAICVYIRTQNAARLIQRIYRRRLQAAQLARIRAQQEQAAARVIQFHARGWITRLRHIRLMKAIYSFQALWRGYLVRKETSRQVRMARARIEKANAQVQEHMRLANRTTVAIDIILGSRRLTDVINACIHLEVVTRWSRECRYRLLEHNVVGVMLSTMSSCNQSAPHKKLLIHAIRTLQHLATDPRCMNTVLPNPAAVDVMIDLLKTYHRKSEDADLFKCIAHLFLLITCEPQCCKPILNTLHSVKRMHEVHVLAKKRLDKDMESTPHATGEKRIQLKKQAKALDMLGTAIGTLKDLMSN